MNAWSQLPNADHIDRILANVKKNPNAWSAARDAARDAAWGVARDEAWNAAMDAARDAARHAAWDAVWGVVWGVASIAARDAARSAAGALIAWDHSGKYLSMTPDELRVWSALTNDPACVLLLPAVIVMQSQFYDKQVRELVA